MARGIFSWHALKPLDSNKNHLNIAVLPRYCVWPRVLIHKYDPSNLWWPLRIIKLGQQKNGKTSPDLLIGTEFDINISAWISPIPLKWRYVKRINVSASDKYFNVMRIILLAYTGSFRTKCSNWPWTSIYDYSVAILWQTLLVGQCTVS